MDGSSVARQVWVSHRTHEMERELYDRAAELAGVDRSKWIRDVLRRAAAAKLSSRGASCMSP
jgi:uncharacterized protein (DUF1778 family)